MSAAKRSHQGQQRVSGKAHTATSKHDSIAPASKRLKSTHATNLQPTGFGALVATDLPRHKLTARLTNGVPEKSASKVDDTRATISTGLNGGSGAIDAISVSSREDSSDDDEDEEEPSGNNAVVNGVNGIAHVQAEGDDVDMADGIDEGDLEEAESDEAPEPSFGDMLKARHPDVIDLGGQLTNPEQSRSLVPAQSSELVTGLSLATVLQQALKTNDRDMLERCFQLRDLQAIKNTIQRLPSPLIAQLLSSLSERMYRRPGRAGGLMVWIQWSLVAHGGYLASQPDLLHKLKALNQVIKQRAQGLQPLLQLKGKLDMLNAQLELRRNTQSNRSAADVIEDEAAVVYNEGDAESGWDDDVPSRVTAITDLQDGDPSDELEDFDPVQQDSSLDDDESEGDEDGLLHLEAEEYNEDEDEDDGEEEGEDDSEADSASEIEEDDVSIHTSDESDSPVPEKRSRRA